MNVRLVQRHVRWNTSSRIFYWADHIGLTLRLDEFLLSYERSSSVTPLGFDEVGKEGGWISSGLKDNLEIGGGLMMPCHTFELLTHTESHISKPRPGI